MESEQKKENPSSGRWPQASMQRQPFAAADQDVQCAETMRAKLSENLARQFRVERVQENGSSANKRTNDHDDSSFSDTIRLPKDDCVWSRRVQAPQQLSRAARPAGQHQCNDCCSKDQTIAELRKAVNEIASNLVDSEAARKSAEDRCKATVNSAASDYEQLMKKFTAAETELNRTRDDLSLQKGMNLSLRAELEGSNRTGSASAAATRQGNVSRELAVDTRQRHPRELPLDQPEFNGTSARDLFTHARQTGVPITVTVQHTVNNYHGSVNQCTGTQHITMQVPRVLPKERAVSTSQRSDGQSLERIRANSKLNFKQTSTPGIFTISGREGTFKYDPTDDAYLITA